MRSVHFQPIGIGISNALTILINATLLNWSWLQIALLCSVITCAICFPTKTWQRLRQVYLVVLPNFLEKIIEVFTSWGKLLNIIAYTLAGLWYLGESLTIVFIWSNMNPKTVANFNHSPILWYEGIFWTVVLLGHMTVVFHELRAKVSDKHSLTKWDRLKNAGSSTWSLWVILLCLPVLGQILTSLILLPYIAKFLRLLSSGITHAVVCLFASAYVPWNSREVLVCLGDGFISAALTSVFLVENYQLTSWVLILSAFLVGYGIGVVHFNLLRRLIPVLEPYRIRV